MIPFAPLVAAVEDWLKAIVPLVMVAVWLLNWLVSDKKPQQPPKRVPQLPDRPRPAGAKPAGGARRKIEDEVSDFLRQAESKRGAGGQQDRGGQPAQARPADRPPQQRPQPSRRPAAPVEVEVVEVDAVDRPTQSVAAHVQQVELERQQRLESSRPKRLDAVDLADDQMREHLHETFDHRVGTLAGEQQPRQPGRREDVSPAARVRAMLAEPAQVRQAIVLSEILNRPVDRW